MLIWKVVVSCFLYSVPVAKTRLPEWDGAVSKLISEPSIFVSSPPLLSKWQIMKP